MISKKHLDEFKRLYLVNYGITLDDETATDLATQFLELMRVLIYPDEA